MLGEIERLFLGHTLGHSLSQAGARTILGHFYLSADEAPFCLGQFGLDFLSFFILKRKTSKREHECTPNTGRMLSKRIL